MTHYKSVILIFFVILPVMGEQKPGKASNMEKISVQKDSQSPKIKKYGISIVWDRENDRIHGTFFLPRDIIKVTGNIHERLVLAVTSGLLNFAGYIAPETAVFDNDLEKTKDGIRGWFSFPADLLVSLEKDRRFFLTVSLYTYKSNTLKWPVEK